MIDPAAHLAGERRVRLAGLLLAIACAAAVMLSPANAEAGELYGRNYCTNVTLGHLGGANDNCTSGYWGYNKVERGYSAQHSTCVSSTTNGEKSGVNVSWACSIGGGYEIYNTVNQYAWTKSIIRNNTTGDSESVVATEWYCNGGPPC
jgi:hypothetical protein